MREWLSEMTNPHYLKLIDLSYLIQREKDKSVLLHHHHPTQACATFWVTS